jgi:hypothetical protein
MFDDVVVCVGRSSERHFRAAFPGALWQKAPVLEHVALCNVREGPHASHRSCKDPCLFGQVSSVSFLLPVYFARCPFLPPVSHRYVCFEISPEPRAAPERRTAKRWFTSSMPCAPTSRRASTWSASYPSEQALCPDLSSASARVCLNALYCVRDQVTRSCCPLIAQLWAEGQTERRAAGGRRRQSVWPPGHPRMNA